MLYIPLVASDRVVVVQSESGKTARFCEAKAGLPFLRQYRLDVGTYQLNLKGFADVTVNIKAGKTATLQLSQDRVSVTHKKPQVLKLALKPSGPISAREKSVQLRRPCISPQSCRHAVRVHASRASL